MTENSQKKAEFVWDDVKLKAAEGIARGDNRQSLAISLGTSDRTVRRWAEHQEFQRKVDEIVQDIDIAQKSERIKIAKKEIKRVLKRLELNEDRPGSRDLVALLRFVGDEVGDLQEHKVLKIIWDEKDDDKGTGN